MIISKNKGNYKKIDKKLIKNNNKLNQYTSKNESSNYFWFIRRSKRYI